MKKSAPSNHVQPIDLTNEHQDNIFNGSEFAIAAESTTPPNELKEV